MSFPEAPPPTQVVSHAGDHVRSARIMPDAVKRTCIGCRNHKLLLVKARLVHACFQQNLRSLVTGQEVGIECETARSSGACGASGAYWEPG
jgi:hypothetical protein